ncbi:hypothetical protein PHAVU_001G268700 [Phaseolus vulgaris]|uniref:O-methyltransferase domain-containing protein n=1 Tax=Phaseolus vulgaris TaxID=3885 RepID=V7D0E3_PHAVU|nr:hypothetical protein PHAVU_001G268700g [Phaseolus vulgaris]ESW35834.1 hypothetical protein PHAVU_001G268700g [Phaseolus vulgaris]
MEKIEREGVSVEEEEEEEAEASVEIWKYIFGFVEMAVVKCAIELGIAEAIEKHGRPMTLSEISSAIGCDPSLLKRIMRFLVRRKIFKPVTNGYSQTPLSRRFIREGKQSMAALLLLESSPVMLAPWHSLSARVMANGRPSFQNTHGEDVWRFAAANLDHSNLINEGMACDTKLVIPVIIRSCSEAFDGVESVVDVGGGNGSAMRILLEALPSIRAMNFDLPHVIAQAPPCDGLQHVAGNMFESVPEADAVFLKWVLHDWSDEECIEILKKCREGVSKEKGRVVIVEAVIEEEEEGSKLADVGVVLDMVMMAHTNFGKERTLKEWEYVIKTAGFSSFTVKPIHAVQSVILTFY